MTNKIYLYIKSSYRQPNETTSNWKCVIPSGLLRSYDKDYYTLSVTSLYCINSLFQMDETNNEFYIVIRDMSKIYFDIYFFLL